MYFFLRFYTGDNIWSAQVNITKCRIKSSTDDAARGTSDGGRGRSRNGQRNSAPIDYDSCPLQISVAPRRPPDVLNPKTRYFNDCRHMDFVIVYHETFLIYTGGEIDNY